MKKKFEFDNVFSLNVFDDIKGEIIVKYPHIKFSINKEKFEISDNNASSLLEFLLSVSIVS